MAEVLIGLGSNLGDREAQLRTAIRRLRECGRVGPISSLYETEPVGYAEQGDFLNACLRLETELSPESLLTWAQAIEQALERTRSIRNGPRTMDVDLLLWRDASGPLLRDDAPLLPHPRMHLRRFVLEPLAEIAADWRHPTLDKTVGEILAELPTAEAVRAISSPTWPPAPRP
ncbi:MAG: 2-amino-4-hydroxy-6-hydroxymethyldihydropteridine diphosphokinase [Acidobacteria bacterium]|nr:2-amino-4-hydroxy-6-hydroxymethyldihydropteridine diphosphokinase [Acidobacteriota bacterium]